MSHSSDKVDRETLQLARMQGDSQDGFSCVGFEEGRIPHVQPTPEVVGVQDRSVSNSAQVATPTTRQRPGSTLDQSVVRQHQQFIFGNDLSCVSRSADESDRSESAPNVGNIHSKQPPPVVSASGSSKRRRDDEPATQLSNSPGKKLFNSRVNNSSITQYLKKTNEAHATSPVSTPVKSIVAATASLETPAVSVSSNNGTIDLSSLPNQYKPMFVNELAKVKAALLEGHRKREADQEAQLQALNNQASSQKNEIVALKSGQDKRTEQSSQALVDTLRKLAAKERKELELRLHENRKTYGYQVVLRDSQGIDIANENGQVWHDGELIRSSQTRLKALNEEKTVLEAERKRILKLKGARVKTTGPAAAVSSLDDELLGQLADTGLQLQDSASTPATVVGEAALSALELNEIDEVCKLRQLNVKRDLTIVQTQLEDFERQKITLMREEQQFMDEAVSRFSGYPQIDNRYLFQNLLGKGGFSEVYRAFDLVLQKYVACKLHQLNPLWSEERTKNYLKHVIRESRIQKGQLHKRIVRMLDVFKVDSNTLVTVQDLCDGGDLDVYLKLHKQQAEKEARVIQWQIFSGLRKLNEGAHRVIHYDLKPANIQFHSGEVKITDFGLAKELEGNNTNIELTSQGAGTLAYLPPECFVTSYTPTISSAVDVWSCGIIFFQMLFGQRPFDFPQHSAEHLHKQKKVDIEFPSKPVISDAAKDFIMRCLSINPLDRPDIFHIFEDPYFKFTKEK